MSEPENNYSRLNRKKGPNRANTIMNILIAVVIVLIIITASMIFFGGDSKNKVDEKKSPETEETKGNTTEDNEEQPKVDNGDEDSSTDKDEPIEDTDDAGDAGDADEKGVITYKSPEDKVIKETIIDTGWEPVGTKQTGEHVSLYDGTSDDWHEKVEAISYVTGLSKDDMIIWKIRNGGNPQKSVGIVSSKDEAKKYRVYLDWVDGEGWQPVKMDILATLEFDFNK